MSVEKKKEAKGKQKGSKREAKGSKKGAKGSKREQKGAKGSKRERSKQSEPEGYEDIRRCLCSGRFRTCP
jgi:hypothetical protein